MSREQIEEMANDIEKSHWKIVQDFMGCHINSEEMAEHLYTAGYRKQSDVLIIPEMTDDDIQRAMDFIKKSRLQIIADDKSEAWISVEDRLPDKEGIYLTYTDKNKMLFDVFCIYPSHGTKFWVGGNGKVTHWMPLPEAPKMKGGAE